MNCTIEGHFFLMFPFLAIAVISDILAIAMFFFFRNSHSAYEWVLLTWLVISFATSVVLTVFLVFSYRRWNRIRREEARERVEQIVAFESALREGGQSNVHARLFGLQS